MVILKKIKASTLMETLMATVLIVVVFMMASMILNNTFSNQIKNNKHQLNNVIYELEYKYLTDNISLPYESEYKDWVIYMYANDDEASQEIIISASQKNTEKQVIKTIYAY